MINKGVYPTMITPYNRDHSIDFGAVRAIVDFYVRRGCAGVFAVCQSSEMAYLSLRERSALCEAVVNAAKDKLTVVASGHVSADLEDQAEELRAMYDAGAQAVVLVSNRLADSGEDDGIWIGRLDALIEALPQQAVLGMYECPAPYKRLLTEKTLGRLAQSGRFAFIKDTCCDAAELRRRLGQLAGSGVKLFNANSATLLDSLRNGGSGFSGVMANFHPELYVWLCEHYGEQPETAEKLQALLTYMSFAESVCYPVCAKYHMDRDGVAMNILSRSADEARFNALSRSTVDQITRLEEMARELVNISI